MKDKIPYYETANMFFVGTVFAIALCFLLYDRVYLSEAMKTLIKYCEKWSVIVSVASLVAMYEIGFILNQIGSFTLGFLFPKLKLEKK